MKYPTLRWGTLNVVQCAVPIFPHSLSGNHATQAHYTNIIYMHDIFNNRISHNSVKKKCQRPYFCVKMARGMSSKNML